MQRFLDIGLRESRATARSPSQAFLLWALPCIGWLATFYIFEVRIDRWPNEISGYPVFRDFANLWSGGIAALNHQFGSLFDRNLHDAEIGRLLAIPLRLLCGLIRQRLYCRFCPSHCCPIRGPVRREASLA